MDEFGLIAKYLRPLAGAGGLDLRDDAALLSVPPGEELVLTADAIVEGVHFLPDDAIDLVARKLLRVNVSDLAAKGARPIGYLLTCCWPKSTREETIARFAQGLAEDQKEFGITLLGGDTTSTNGPLTLSLTAIGSVPLGRMVRRSGAKLGDLILLTGTIGDAGLGLRVAKGETLGAGDAFLAGRYRLPEPRLTFGLTLRGFASAAIDVSDGLIADAGHVAEASGLAIEIEAARLPLSDPARGWLERGGDIGFLATCGDDYEICFSAPPAFLAQVHVAATAAGTRVTEIGRVVEGAGARLLGPGGREVTLPRKGYSHF